MASAGSGTSNGSAAASAAAAAAAAAAVAAGSAIPSYAPHLDTLNDYAAQHQLHPLIKNMVTALFQQQPSQPIQFMIEYLQGQKQSSSPPSPVSTSRSSGSVGTLPVLSVDGPATFSSSAGSRGRNRRSGVSAEPIDTKQAAADAALPIRVIPKNDQQTASIRRAVANNFLFSQLDDNEMKQVIDAMQDRTYQAGDTIIQQGDPGDEFFVLDSGECACFINQPNGAEPKKVKTYQHSESFGELALMYGVPRAATIKATTNVLCWVMDRVTFRRLLLGSTSKKRSTYETFLSRIPVLSGLDRYERAKVADALQEQTYKDGEYIIKQGDSSADHRFYFLAEGEAIATKSIPGVNDGFPVQVWHYSEPGGYFGELALLHDAPRAANVIAKGRAKCCSLDRDSFVRLLGPIEQILNRTQDQYREKEREIAKAKASSESTPVTHLPPTSPPSLTSSISYIASPSSPEQRARITAWLQQDVICSSLDAQQQHIIMESCNQRRYPAGSIVFSQSSSHDYTWYMLAEGTCEAWVDDRKVRVYTPGSSFGEETFLSNAGSRSGTVRCVTEVVVFVLDRSLFQRLISPLIQEKRNKYGEWIQQIPLFSPLNHYSRLLLLADMVEMTFQDGQEIIKQGDNHADRFYIIMEGEARAVKTMSGQKKGLEVYSYQSGDFFGELGILKSQPRACTIQAINGPLRVGSWNRSSFNRLFACDSELIKQFQAYEIRYQAAETELQEQRI